MIFSSPPQLGQCAMSISNTRLSSLDRVEVVTGLEQFCASGNLDARSHHSAVHHIKLIFGQPDRQADFAQVAMRAHDSAMRRVQGPVDGFLHGFLPGPHEKGRPRDQTGIEAAKMP